MLWLVGMPSVASGRFQTGVCLDFLDFSFIFRLVKSGDLEPHRSSSLAVAGGGKLPYDVLQKSVLNLVTC